MCIVYESFAVRGRPPYYTYNSTIQATATSYFCLVASSSLFLSLIEMRRGLKIDWLNHKILTNHGAQQDLENLLGINTVFGPFLNSRLAY